MICSKAMNKRRAAEIFFSYFINTAVQFSVIRKRYIDKLSVQACFMI
jgi:hypothetical protein